MKNLTRYLTIALCTLTLGGCVSREQADSTLSKGCRAGIDSLLPEETTISTVSNTAFATSDLGRDMRKVTLTAQTSDGWDEREETFECTFQESFGFLGMNHSAAIHQIRFPDAVYGRVDGEIVGDLQDFLKLTDAVHDAMHH